MKYEELPWHSRLVIYILLIILSAIVLYPLCWIIMASFRTNIEIMVNPFGLPQKLNLQNLAEVWVEKNFARYFLNSAIMSGCSVVLIVFFSAIAGYTFAKKRFAARGALFLFIILGMMIPVEVRLIPVFRLMASLQLRNTIWSVVLVYIGQCSFGILVSRAYFLSIPLEIDDAARVDGCSEWQIFWKINFPLAAPVMVTIGLFYLIWTWNGFLWPLILIQERSAFTVQLGVAFFKGRYMTDWASQASALSSAVVPPLVLYILFHKKIERGIMSGGLKM